MVLCSKGNEMNSTTPAKSGDLAKGDVVAYITPAGEWARAYVQSPVVVDEKSGRIKFHGVALDVEWLPLPAKIVYGSVSQLVWGYVDDVIEVLGKDNPKRIFD